MKAAFVTILYTLACLTLLLLNDYIFVALGQPNDYWSDGLVEGFINTIFAVGYFAIFFNSLKIQNTLVKFWVSSLLALVSIVIFVLGAFLILVNFHTSIGGTL